MRLSEKDIDQSGATDLVCEREGRRLVNPHQRRMNDETAVGAECQSKLYRFDSVVPAIGIAGEIGFAHAGNEVPDIAPVSDRASKSKEHQVSSRHKGRRQTGLSDSDLSFTGERCF